MELPVPVVVSLVALLVAISATYNAYLLKGGKLAISQIFVVLGMIVLIFSQLVDWFAPEFQLVSFVQFTDLLFIAGLAILLLSSLRLRSSLK